METNGWPTLDASPPNVPELPEDATPTEIARALGTVILEWAARWPKVVHALDYLQGATMGAKAEAERASSDSRRTREAVAHLDRKVVELVRRQNPNLPPMRGETPSSHALVEEVRSEVKDSFEQLAKKTSGPYLSGRPAELTDLAVKVFDAKWNEREETLRRRAMEDRIAAIDALEVKAKKEREDEQKRVEDERRDAKKEAARAAQNFRLLLRYGLLAAFLTSIAASAGAYAWGRATHSVPAPIEAPTHPEHP